jgi:hypothetical protein
MCVLFLDGCEYGFRVSNYSSNLHSYIIFLLFFYYFNVESTMTAEIVEQKNWWFSVAET